MLGREEGIMRDSFKKKKKNKRLSSQWKVLANLFSMHDFKVF
jgi:hypothetical protein